MFACDAYNAMTTDRPYRGAMPREAAVAELDANTGTQFDPKIVSALIKVVEHGRTRLGHEHRRGPCRPGRGAGPAERRRSRS